MAITLTIAGVDRTAYLQRLSWSVQKEYANETFRGDLRDLVFSASAYAPTVGQAVTLHHGTDLLFGGRITDVKRGRLEDEGPIVTTIDARGWESLAEEVVVTDTLASTSALAMGYALFLAYLQPRGCTWVSSTSGGPTVPELVFDHQPLSTVYQQISKLTNYLFRINGEKAAGMVAPGELDAPITWTGADVLKGFTFTKTRADRATRLYVRTGGTGTVSHTETNTGNGVATVFPLHVEPKDAPTEVIEEGVTFALPSATWTYNAPLKALVRASALGVADAVSVTYNVDLPAWVREWSSTVEDATGAVDATLAVDAVLQLTEVIDLEQARALGQAEIARRVSEPWEAHGVTRLPGWYPLLRLPIDMTAEHGIDADFLVKSVTVTPDDIDEASNDHHVSYAVHAIEGDTPGRMWDELFRELQGGGSGGGIAITGTSSGSGGVSGSASLPEGTTFHVGGSNGQTFLATTTWAAVPEAIPTRLGGPGMAGTWTLRVPMYQMSAGTMQVRLLDQTATAIAGTDVVLGSVLSTTATGSYVDVSFYDYEEGSVAAPSSVNDVLLQVAVTSGSREVVVGHATLVKA